MRSILIKVFVLLLLAAPVLAKDAQGSKKSAAETTPQDKFIPSVKFNGFVQFWVQDLNNIWDMKVAHARLKTTALVDENTSLVLLPEMAPAGFVLLDAYAVRNLGDQWSFQAGQFKPAFGDDRYLTPAQLKRVNYSQMTLSALPAAANAWDLGFEVKKTFDQVTFQGDLLQGAGPNKAVDNDSIKDLAGKVEWKDQNFAVGCSYYGGTSNGKGFTAYQNWMDANVRFNSEGFDARVEAIWAPANRGYYFGQIAYKAGDWEPLAWGELGFNASTQIYQVLGGGINYWPASKTRLSLDVVLSGVVDFSAPAMAVLQVEQLF